MSKIISEFDKQEYIRLFQQEDEESYTNIAGILNDILNYNDGLSGIWDDDLEDIIEIIFYYENEDYDDSECKINAFLNYSEEYIEKHYDLNEEQITYLHKLVREML